MAERPLLVIPCSNEPPFPQGLQHVVELGQGEVLMLGEHSLADGVEGFRFNADLVLKRFRWICWKGERVKAA